MTQQHTSSFASAAEQQPPSPPPPTPAEWASAPRRSGRSVGRAIGYAVALLPIALPGLLALVVPEFVAPLTDSRVSIIGMPMGLLAIALLGLLAVIGVLAVRFIRQPAVVALVLLWTTLLALTVITFAPALVLILINLKT